MLGLYSGCEMMSHIRRELVHALAEEMLKSGLIDFKEGVTEVECAPIVKAEIHAYMPDMKYVTLEEFFKHAANDYKYDLAQYIVRPGEKTDIKDRFNQDLYIGNFVAIEDNGDIIYQMVLPAKTKNDKPYIGGFIYENGEFKCFDINYVYCDTLIPPRMEKVKSVKF